MSLSRVVVNALGLDPATLSSLPHDEARILRALFEKAKATDINSNEPLEVALTPQDGVKLPVRPSLCLGLTFSLFFLLICCFSL